MIRIILDRMATISVLAIALTGFALLQDTFLQTRTLASTIVVDRSDVSTSLYYHTLNPIWEKNSIVNRTAFVR